MNDTYYFSHDYNARTDPKIKRLLARHGMVGYGLFWSIVEDLYNNANALPLDCDGIAYDLRSDVNLVHSVIHDFNLFQIDGQTFGSVSVERRLSERKTKSNSAKNSANIRWQKYRESQLLNANAMQTHSDGNAIKERKGKEIKEKEIKVESNTRDLSIYGNFETVSKNITEDEIFLTEAAHLLNTTIETVKEFSEKKLLEMKATGAISRYSVSAIRGFILKDFKQQKETNHKGNSATAIIEQAERVKRKISGQ